MGDTKGIQTNIAENVQEDEREMARQSGGEAQRPGLTASRAAHEGPRLLLIAPSRSLAKSQQSTSSRHPRKQREDQTKRHPDSFTVIIVSHALARSPIGVSNRVCHI